MTSLPSSSSGSHPRTRLNERNFLKESVGCSHKRRTSFLSQPNRPGGVTFLTIIEVVLGVLLLLGVVATKVQFMHRIRWSVESATILLLILAITSFCLAYGFWSGKAWAWTIGMALAVFGIIFSVFSLYVRPTLGEVIYLLANLIVIYYLIQPRIHGYFGRHMPQK